MFAVITSSISATIPVFFWKFVGLTCTNYSGTMQNCIIYQLDC